MNYYTFFKEELSNTITYNFITEAGYVYAVEFDFSLYSDYLDNHPNLLKKSVSLIIHQVSIGDKKKQNRTKLFCTIEKCIDDFIDNQEDDMILIYHCDYSDSKQEHRNRIFNSWYAKSILRETITKSDFNIEFDGQSYYMGYLTKSNNPNAQEIEQEFNEFAVQLPYISSK